MFIDLIMVKFIEVVLSRKGAYIEAFEEYEPYKSTYTYRAFWILRMLVEGIPLLLLALFTCLLIWLVDNIRGM